MKGTPSVQATTTRPRTTATTDGDGVVSHAGTRLLADVADSVGVSAALSDALGGLRERRSGHEPGRVLTDVAVMLADGGEAISDLAVLRDQPDVLGAVASTATAWRVLDAVDDDALAAVRAARAAARERAWLLRAEAGRGIASSRAGGRDWPGLVLDVDATLIQVHSEKQSAALNFKGGFGYHQVLVWLDNTNEALAGLLRPGNAGANTAADHIKVLDLALAQIPDTHRHGTPILIRARLLPAMARARAVVARPAWPAGGVLGRVHHDRAGAAGDPGAARDCVDTGDRGRRIVARWRRCRRADRDAARCDRGGLARRDALTFITAAGSRRAHGADLQV
jgi:hypothetical protein